MADTDDVVGVLSKIKEGVVRFSRPVSEAFGQLIAGNINGLIDGKNALDAVVNPGGDINWGTQTDGSIPESKIATSTTYSINQSGTTSPVSVFTASYDCAVFFDPTEMRFLTSSPSDVQRIYVENQYVDNGVNKDRFLYFNDSATTSTGVFYSVIMRSGDVLKYETNGSGGDRLIGTVFVRRL